jgi:hypothetical protein
LPPSSWAGGLGGKYLILPPGYDGPLPEGGFFIGRAGTAHVLFLAHMFLEKDSPEPAVKQIHKFLKVCPYVAGGAGTSFATFLRAEAQLGSITPPPGTIFYEGSGRVMNTIAPNDFSCYEMLNSSWRMPLFSMCWRRYPLAVLCSPNPTAQTTCARAVF